MKKLKENYLFFVICLLFILLCILIYYIINKNDKISSDLSLRIVSLSPSTTEYIYNIGLDKYLIANTIYCNYPEDAKSKEKIGTFNDINFEQIVALKINTAVIQQDMNKAKKQLENMGIKVVEIKNNTIEEIILSYDILGETFNIKDVTDKKKEQITKKIADIKEKIAFKSGSKAIVSIFRNYGSPVSKITVAGGNNIYNDIFKILNLENPFEKYPAYSEISLESLFVSNPDFIFDMYHGRDTKNAKDDWNNMPLNAVKNNNLIILNDVYLSLPGPRIDMIIEKFAKEYFGKIYD